MLVNVGLNIKSVLFGVETASHIKSKGLICAATKLRGVLADGYRMLIHNTVKGLIFLRIERKISDGSEIVTYG